MAINQSGLPGRRGILAAAALGLALVSSPAEAQIFGGIFAERFYAPLPGHYGGYYGPRYHRGIDSAAVVDLVRSEGFRQLTPPVYRGDVYTLEATDQRGARVRLFVDSARGFIRGGQVIGRGRAQPEAPRRRETARVAPIPRDPPIFRAPEAPASAPPQAAPKILITPETRRPQPRPPVAARPAPQLAPAAPPAARPDERPAAATPPAAAPKILITPDAAMPKPVQPRPPAQAQQPRPATPAAQPRRIEILPPAALDDAPSQRRPAQPGINTVPPAGLD